MKRKPKQNHIITQGQHNAADISQETDGVNRGRPAYYPAPALWPAGCLASQPVFNLSRFTSVFPPMLRMLQRWRQSFLACICGRGCGQGHSQPVISDPLFTRHHFPVVWSTFNVLNGLNPSELPFK
ncbi:hypothetical protein L3Q82_026886 [Scortum barcoo]|uniref:Uncharacterized protein n=1 Tax=Scortum barcoo TaxID=214431 RepID=A0ACB8WK04_9TELE|nr:hypothetical protein L3Q82_026886 [Scortum barcoo]